MDTFKTNFIPFGGDWNPEQWNEEVREKDMEMLSPAGINIVTINVFSWAALQPSEEEYDFSDLDSIIELATKSGMSICLATSTGAHPAWMARKYPDILRVDIDGRKHVFGQRENSCPNSPTYRKYAARLAQKLSERYKNQKNIVAWHISNEFNGQCYCENCQKAFRIWLQKKYKTLENLNYAWNTHFWGHIYYSWDDIQVPSKLNERWDEKLQENRTSCQIQVIDYFRFQSDSQLECYNLESDILHKITPQIPVTTNLMGTYFELDYHKWAKSMDFISFDSYPFPQDSYTRIAFRHEVMRGCKRDKPFALMESTVNVVNWQPYSKIKRPGVMRLESYQALAHGSDSVMFFQLHRSRGCMEKFHGAIIDHFATTETRVFKETSALGNELKKLAGVFVDSTEKPRAALIFDWESMWGLSFSSGPSFDLKYEEEVYKYYDALLRENIGVDIISPDESLDRYSLVVAPVLYMLKDKAAENIKKFVENGGTFVTTTMSGLVDENDLVTTEGYPGKLRKICGVWVEETDALLPTDENSIVIQDGNLKGEYKAKILCDIMHAENAEVVATYKTDFYAETPAICRNKFGKGEAWYIGTCFEMEKNGAEFLRKFFRNLAEENPNLRITEPVENVEFTERAKNGEKFLFILNHNEGGAKISSPESGTELLSGQKIKKGEKIELEKNGVKIIRCN